MKNLDSKYIWIIGASSGIGAALARELSNQGAKIALSARREDKLEDIKATLKGEGHIVIPCDASDTKSMAAALETILTHFPSLHSSLFMAVTYKPHDGERTPLPDIQKMWDVNVMGAFTMIDLVVPYFEQQGQGQVVLCASVAGYRGLPTGQPYCATKAALINLAESLKVEMEPKNIDVKVICPGFVKTPLTAKNKFTMPMIIEADVAAREIAKGLCSNQFEIHFPKRFTYIMKAIHLLPNRLYFMVARHLMNQNRGKEFPVSESH